MRKFTAAALALAANTFLLGPSARADITVGVIPSLSGPISSIGVPYAKGIAAGVAAIGEIAGQKVKVVQLRHAPAPPGGAGRAPPLPPSGARRTGSTSPPPPPARRRPSPSTASPTRPRCR